jgi:glucarate dehydratase
MGHGGSMSALRISAVTVTPVAFADPPLLNSVGVHEPFALRAVVEVSTDGGLSGLGETYADERHLAALRAAADAIVGADAYRTEQIYRRVQAIAAPDTPIASGLIGDSSATDRAFAHLPPAIRAGRARARNLRPSRPVLLIFPAASSAPVPR